MSMRDAGIIEATCSPCTYASADDGSIVVARLDDDITASASNIGNRLLLLPRKPDFVPIEVDPRRVDSFAIEGIYVGIIRH